MEREIDLLNNNYLNYRNRCLDSPYIHYWSPQRYIKDHPLILIGFAYTILILSA